MEEAHDPKNGEGRPGCCGGHLAGRQPGSPRFHPSSLLAGTFCRGQDCAGPGGGCGACVAACTRAEVWVFETEARAEISGFIGLLGDYIAGIFVRRGARSGGVGRQLLDHVKTSRGQLRLQVYRKNLRAAAFYQREGFRVLEEGVDPETGEAELLMEWRWDGPQS